MPTKIITPFVIGLSAPLSYCSTYIVYCEPCRSLARPIMPPLSLEPRTKTRLHLHSPHLTCLVMHRNPMNLQKTPLSALLLQRHSQTALLAIQAQQTQQQANQTPRQACLGTPLQAAAAAADLPLVMHNQTNQLQIVCSPVLASHHHSHPQIVVSLEEAPRKHLHLQAGTFSAAWEVHRLHLSLNHQEASSAL